MEDATIARLLDINRQFYQTFALQFSQTRQRLQPGVLHILETYFSKARQPFTVLDLGCGNGELARRLADLNPQGAYVGVDLSPGLLQEAQQNYAATMQASFIQLDLANPGWDRALVNQGLVTQPPFDRILAFALLHHIPGRALRMEILRSVRQLATREGLFIHSEWQFLNSPRLRQRIQPWEAAGMSPAEVEAGDYLLDWKHGGYGLRYVHQFSLQELESMANKAGFEIIDNFMSDGEGGNLGLYQVWKAV